MRDLELPPSDDAWRDLREHAVERVSKMMEGWTLDTLEDLSLLLQWKMSASLPGASTAPDLCFWTGIVES